LRTVDLIQKKRDGGVLHREEIRHLIQGYVQGNIPDYQMAAWAMTVFYQGMNPEETADLTMEMVESGDQIHMGQIQGIKVDKHSTGGVGDTTTLVLAPLVAAAGVPVAKMSGRGLGHTGGTIDKFETFPGFSVELTKEQFIHQVNETGVAITGQSGNLTPADKKLYSLRDVTATVDSIPLIASSIMSKKIAAGADAIVLDVKTGNGAFMKTREDSFELAKAMVSIGTHIGRETIAIISDMDQPLGYAVGNALEVREAIETLQGRGPKDLEELSLSLGAYMCLLAKRVNSFEEGVTLLKGCLHDGSALTKLKELVAAQGGDASLVDEPDKLPTAAYIEPVVSDTSGYIESIDAEAVGIAAMTLGAGRETKESQVDLAVGVVLNKKVGDPVQKGEPLAYLHANDKSRLDLVSQTIREDFVISQNPVNIAPLIYGAVTKENLI
jgi:pyrimidine-nucleoside phosphorylase